MKGMAKMFRELKRIDVDINQVRNNIELKRIERDTKVDRSETCFGGLTKTTLKQYNEGAERAKKLSKKLL